MIGIQGETLNHTDTPVPVVLGGENGALPIIRALAKIGLRSIVASIHEDDNTFRSRYCRQAVLLKEFGTASDQENLAILINIARHCSAKPVLFWGSDREVQFVSRQQDELSKWYRFVSCDSTLAEKLVDKALFSVFAQEQGLPIPKTMFFYSHEEVYSRLSTIPLPCIIKPVVPREWFTPHIMAKYGSYKHALHRHRTAEQVVEFIKDIPNIDKGLIIQEFIDGNDKDLCSFHAYFNSSSEPIAAFVGRKIRTSPMHVGGSAFIETFSDEKLLQLGLDTCRKIQFKGIVKIDFIRNPRTNEYVILEFNPRFTLWNYLGAFAGINIPALWYKDLTGEKVRPTTQYAPNRRWVCFRADLKALPSYLKAGELTIGSWLRSYFAPKVYHTLAWDDPWPLAFTFPQFVMRKLKLRRLRKSTGIA